MVTVFKLVPAVDMRLFFFFLTVHYGDQLPPLVVGCGSAHKLAHWPTTISFNVDRLKVLLAQALT